MSDNKATVKFAILHGLSEQWHTGDAGKVVDSIMVSLFGNDIRDALQDYIMELDIGGTP